MASSQYDNWPLALPLVLLGIGSFLKEDWNHSSAELIYSTSLRPPTSRHTSDAHDNISFHAFSIFVLMLLITQLFQLYSLSLSQESEASIFGGSAAATCLPAINDVNLVVLPCTGTQSIRPDEPRNPSTSA